MVLTGVGALSAGIDQGLWVKVLPDYAAKFPNVLDNYLPAARKMNDLAQNQALVVTYFVERERYDPYEIVIVGEQRRELIRADVEIDAHERQPRAVASGVRDDVASERSMR